MVKIGTAINVGATAAPFVGAVSTAAGYAAEGQSAGALIQGVNGVTRSYAVAKAGGAAATAGAIWATGKLGAAAGSWAGPLGAGTGFILGVGAAWLAGKLWDNTIGAGADALTQKVQDINAGMKYAGGRSEFEGQTVAGETRDISRDSVQQQTRENIRISRPSGGGGGGCGGDCGRH